MARHWRSGMIVGTFGGLGVLIVSLSVAAAAVAAPVRAAEGDWPQWHGPNRDNISTEKGLLQEWPKEGPRLAWKAVGLGAGCSSVSVAGGRIYTMGDLDGASHVIALELDGGRKAWSAKVGAAGG